MELNMKNYILLNEYLTTIEAVLKTEQTFDEKKLYFAHRYLNDDKEPVSRNLMRLFEVSDDDLNKHLENVSGIIDTARLVKDGDMKDTARYSQDEFKIDSFYNDFRYLKKTKALRKIVDLEDVVQDVKDNKYTIRHCFLRNGFYSIRFVCEHTENSDLNIYFNFGFDNSQKEVYEPHLLFLKDKDVILKDENLINRVFLNRSQCRVSDIVEMMHEINLDEIKDLILEYDYIKHFDFEKAKSKYLACIEFIKLIKKQLKNF